MKERFWYICPFCGSNVSNGLCYGCGNNNLPDMSFENKSDFKFIGFYTYKNNVQRYISMYLCRQEAKRT